MLTLNEMKKYINEYKTEEINKFKKILPSIGEHILKSYQIFDFQLYCLNDFRVDLLEHGLSASLLEETFFDKITKKEYFNATISDHLDSNKYDDLLLKSNLIIWNVLYSNSKNTATKEDLFHFVLAAAIVSYKKIELIKKAINYPKFTKVFEKHFSDNEEENIQFFMEDAIMLSIVAFYKTGIMEINESNQDEIDAFLNRLI